MEKRKDDEITINGKNYKSCKLKMVELYNGKKIEWKGWYNLILDLGGPEFDKPIAGPIDPETSKQLMLSIKMSIKK
jgi:hypothetical protein